MDSPTVVVISVVVVIGILISAIVGFFVQQQKNHETEQAFSGLAAGAGLQSSPRTTRTASGSTTARSRSG